VINSQFYGNYFSIVYATCTSNIIRVVSVVSLYAGELSFIIGKCTSFGKNVFWALEVVYKRLRHLTFDFKLR